MNCINTQKKEGTSRKQNKTHPKKSRNKKKSTPQKRKLRGKYAKQSAKSRTLIKVLPECMKVEKFVKKGTNVYQEGIEKQRIRI